jgi:hypothetical protein
MIRKPLILLFFLATSVLYGQPGDPGDDVDGEVPIPGIGILLAAGAAFGAKKAYDVYRRREK